jgi:membrane protein insertase Oxa1/YidC/SpoIIIJ
MSMSAMLPEVVQNFSIWGGTGYMLKTINMDGTVPFWASFAIISVLLRTALIPLVIYSARMSGRFAKVAPEVQFIVTLFQNDMKKMRTEGKSLYEKRNLFVQNMQTIQTIYKLHNINPLTVFLSPLMQIPFFYYVAHDLRKIVNGADPALAQELTESSFYWVPDLTDPDPWFGLPIAAGAMLYANVEVAIGKRSLSGPTAAKSDFAGLLKDGFQTLAVFMPCFVSQSPAGIQIYLVSSFTFTLFQGAALRSDTVRNALGLPAMGSAPTEPKYAKEFMEFKKMEQKARDIRGDGPVLGKNILAVGFETSFPGTNRPSTIEGSGILPPDMDMDMTPTTNAVKEKPKMDIAPNTMLGGGLFIHGISAPPEQLEAQMAEALKAEEATGGGVAKPKGSEFQDYLTDSKAEAAMEAANHGAVLAPKEEPKVLVPEKIDPEKFKKKKGVHYSKKR